MNFTWATIIPLVITVATAIATASSDVIQGFWGSHGTAAPLVLGAYAVLKLFLPSPVSPGPFPTVAKAPVEL